ncbi:pectinesterase inhibitor-like [Tripterygium wilfordii]|uniref:pectinesterase inhibitor-like n=1 Tax=Tripterygium wilfordii TaxID=458696 RepID=UPI0018F82946|nr:pectinesterase inhibitor-like [Tripterygium wilfordii]
MSSSSIFSSSLSSLLLVFLIITPSLADQTSPNDIVNTVCSKDSNPDFCLMVLPLSSGQTLEGLAKIFINLVYSNAVYAVNRLNEAAKGTSDPQLKQKYSFCSNNISNAVKAIAEAQKLLSTSGNFSGLGSAATTTTAEAEKCLAILEKILHDPLNLLRSVVFLEQYADTVKVISIEFMQYFSNIPMKES